MKYSVITPVYNRADCIRRCLESVIQNIGGREDIEHIVVDDGSSDATPEILKDYAANHSHIQCVFFPQNRGTNAARNAAIAKARGRFCIILDSDDYWDENAIAIIDGTISDHPDIRHFCFAPDDMLQVYEKTPLLAKKKECWLSFEDFLLGRVSGDFVHVMTTNIIKKYPFDEELRIYEGVFFLDFYKEAKRILFVNKVVSHRDRGRKDSVTRGVIRTNKSVILRTIKANEQFVEKFAEDLRKTSEGSSCLCQSQLALLDNYLLLSDYKKAKETIRTIREGGYSMVPRKFQWIYCMRLGWLYYSLLYIYLRVKYDILHTKVK